MAAFLRIFANSLRRKWIEVSRHRFDFIFSLIQICAFVAALFLFLPFYEGERIRLAIATSDVIAYILIGAAFMPLIGLAIWEAANQFAQDFASRTIEIIVVSPVSRCSYIFANIATSALILGIHFLPIFCIALFFVSQLSIDRVLLCCPVIFITYLNLMAAGATMTAIIIVYRRASGAFGLIHTALQFLTGMFVPMLIMPFWLKTIAIALPGTAGIDLTRYILLSCGTIAPIRVELTVMLVETVILIFLSQRLIMAADKIGYEQGYV